jgi:regulator of sigma E protease
VPFTGLPGTALMAGKMINTGPEQVVLFVAVISFSLGLMNLLPLPPLDGGNICIAILRRLTGRYYPARMVRAWSFAGVGLLFGFMFLINGIDLIRSLLNYLPAVPIN